MTWDNFGSVWHIDHVFPCAAYDLTIEENKRKVFHYTNLQPLFKRENIIKSDKVPNNHQPELMLYGQRVLGM